MKTPWTPTNPVKYLFKQLRDGQKIVAEGDATDPHDFSFSAWPCRFIVGSHENVLNDFRDGVVVCTLPACREFAAIIALPRRQASCVLLTNIF